jgi:hypothetical protein
MVANQEIAASCNNPLPISQNTQTTNSARQNIQTREQIAANNLQALIENCQQAIFYRDEINKLLRPIEPRAAHRLGLLNQYQEGQNLLRELGGERFILQNNFGRDQVDDFKQFFEGLNEQQKQKISDLSVANLNHKANESLQARGLELMLITLDFIILTPILNPVTIDISINQTQVNFLHCSKEYHVINAGSHARALQDNSYFIQKTTDEIKEILDSSLRVARGYLAHNASKRLGAGQEREAHSSGIDSQIDKMEQSLPELSILLGEINIDLTPSGVGSLSINNTSPRNAPQTISTTRAIAPNIEQQLP